jgi:hypothetical protein
MTFSMSFTAGSTLLTAFLPIGGLALYSRNEKFQLHVFQPENGLFASPASQQVLLALNHSIFFYPYAQLQPSNSFHVSAEASASLL